MARPVRTAPDSGRYIVPDQWAWESGSKPVSNTFHVSDASKLLQIFIYRNTSANVAITLAQIDKTKAKTRTARPRPTGSRVCGSVRRLNTVWKQYHQHSAKAQRWDPPICRLSYHFPPSSTFVSSALPAVSGGSSPSPQSRSLCGHLSLVLH